MNHTFSPVIFEYLKQSQTDNLKTKHYPKEFLGFKVKISFGMGAPARIPWIAFITEEMQVSNGFYPVYLYYKEENKLILSYGISETYEFDSTWPKEITDAAETITEYFKHKVPRYGNSYVFKSYNVDLKGDHIVLKDDKTGETLSEDSIESDLDIILDQYKKCFDTFEANQTEGDIGIGLFYMEKQLEDFLIQNWENTDLGKRMGLIVEEGELISQQYRTDVGPIDILAKDKKTGSYVVIELKKNQTSDDTVGQLARYMGWVKENLNDDSVTGIIIAGSFSKRLYYAVKMFRDMEVLTYKIDFTLELFDKQQENLETDIN